MNDMSFQNLDNRKGDACQCRNRLYNLAPFLTPNEVDAYFSVVIIARTLMIHLLLDTVLPEFDHCLEIYTFSALQ
jgi:hypothetical protein